MPEPQQTQFSVRIQAKTADGYEIVCMSAGQANGWEIEAGTLQASLPLWDNVNSFVDHATQGRSLRDLCGKITNPKWNETDQGIVATFTPLGPAKTVALACAEDVLTNPLAEAIGFSADFIFTANGRKITKFLKVNSVDLVINPARGGKFLRALNSIQRTDNMPNTLTLPDDLNQSADDLEKLRLSAQTVTNNIQAQGALDTLAATQQAADKLRAQMCTALLQTTLAAAKLPTAWQERIRADFANKIFEPETLEKRINDDRALLSMTTSRSTVQGPHASAMFNEADMIEAAAFDLLGAARPDALKSVQVHALTGIRELYHIMTGDYDLHGGYYPSRAQFQLTTATFPGIVKNALNKSLAQHWADFGKAGYNWWETIATVEHFTSLNDITWMIFGTIGSLPTVLEGAEYTPLMIGDSPETSSFVKKGGYVGLTLEAVDRDDVRAFRAVPREIAFAGIRELSATVAALFTANSNVGPTLADGGALFNANAVTAAAGHANLLTTALGTDFAAWNAVAKAMYNQPMLVAGATGYYGTGKKMALRPKYCLVPIDLFEAAANLFVARGTPTTPDAVYYGTVLPITVPEWTDATDWAAVADPKLVPSIMIGERFGIMPEIFIAGNETDPAMFMNDESRIKVRHFTAVGVADFRPLHKSNVAA